MLTNNPSLPTDGKQEIQPIASLSSLAHTLACKLWPFEYTEKRRTRCGDRFTLHPIVDMSPMVFLSSPRDIRVIATASADVLHAGGGGVLMEPVFGERAFMLRDKDEHANVRDAIMPMFQNRMAQNHTDTMTEVVDREVALWPADEPVSLSPYLDRLTLKAMLTIAIVGLESKSKSESGCGELTYGTLCQRMLDMLSVMATPLLQEPRLRHLPGWRGMWRRFIDHRRAVDELVYTLITERRAKNAAEGRTTRAADRAAENDPHDLLDLLTAARNPDGSPLSDKQVRDNLVSTIIAGHETTAATLGWTLQLLAHNPAVQDRLIEEIDGGLGQASDGPDEANDGPGARDDGLAAMDEDSGERDDLGMMMDDDLGEADNGRRRASAGAGETGGRHGGGSTRSEGPYMNAVIQEALRHRPTFLFLPPRVVLNPIEIDGWHCRPPAQLLACTYLLHHDPELYSRPHTFSPERFLVSSPQPGTLLPWGLGRKRCPGRQLALIEIREVLRRVLSRWLILPADARLARPHWRTALLTPHPRSRVILHSRHSLRPGLSRTRPNSI